MKKIKQPKFTIVATGPFVDVKIPMYRGNGVKQLKAIHSLHQQGIDRLEDKANYLRIGEWISREELIMQPHNKLTVQILHHV